MNDAREIILNLVNISIVELEAAKLVEGVRENETATKQATGYLQAANALLGGFPELYRELIEHPDFMKARKMARSGGFF